MANNINFKQHLCGSIIQNHVDKRRAPHESIHKLLTDDCIISLSAQAEHCQTETLQMCQQDKLKTVNHCCTARSFTKLPAYQGDLKTAKQRATPAIKAALGLHISPLAERNGCCQVHATSPCRCHYAIGPCNQNPHQYQLLQSRAAGQGNISKAPRRS